MENPTHGPNRALGTHPGPRDGAVLSGDPDVMGTSAAMAVDEPAAARQSGAGCWRTTVAPPRGDRAMAPFRATSPELTPQDPPYHIQGQQQHQGIDGRVQEAAASVEARRLLVRSKGQDRFRIGKLGDPQGS